MFFYLYIFIQIDKLYKSNSLIKENTISNYKFAIKIIQNINYNKKLRSNANLKTCTRKN